MDSPPTPQLLRRAYAHQRHLGGSFPPGSTLPGERDLAMQLGVTRPTLREAIQRLARDGWLTVQQGKATAVNNIWQDGGLNVLSGLVKHSEHLPPGFITHLLEVRLDLAPVSPVAPVVLAHQSSSTSHHFSEGDCEGGASPGPD
ncbi:MAG: GntR family transcriptional regulator, partial [Anaerolineae bacterium]|nr:GntR family transcriptional regulator [Anaerolineae bacterium]